MSFLFDQYAVYTFSSSIQAKAEQEAAEAEAKVSQFACFFILM